MPKLLKLSNNEKMRKSARKHKVKLRSWNIPAYQSQTGRRTCPFAGSCAKGCYARQGQYMRPSVKDFQEANLAETLTGNEFVENMIYTIKSHKLTHLRIHDSGDFYSRGYRNQWFSIAEQCPSVKFYAYTKSHDLFRETSYPENLTIVFSFGSSRDSAINKATERHSIIIGKNDKIPRGYADASDDDLMIFKGSKVALRYHGYDSRAITAGV